MARKKEAFSRYDVADYLKSNPSVATASRSSRRWD